MSRRKKSGTLTERRVLLAIRVWGFTAWRPARMNTVYMEPPSNRPTIYKAFRVRLSTIQALCERGELVEIVSRDPNVSDVEYRHPEGKVIHQ